MVTIKNDEYDKKSTSTDVNYAKTALTATKSAIPTVKKDKIAENGQNLGVGHGNFKNCAV